jgi:hypothetical protein
MMAASGVVMVMRRRMFVILLAIGCGTADGEICELTPAVANAGPDQSVRVGDRVSLDGRGSRADALIVFDWTITSAPPDSMARIAQRYVAQPDFVPDREGAYVVTLVIRAAACVSPPDTVTVTAVAL